jgi:hypothetical protein
MGKLALDQQARVREFLSRPSVHQGQHRSRSRDPPPSTRDGESSLLRAAAKSPARETVFPERSPQGLGDPDPDSIRYLLNFPALFKI